ncbi:DNA alkylation repair protein [Acetobacterium woodii]|uniref:Putative DNA alkylation repair enzyme n=1 Tax=Acetobacterium woodii (strain ATCC 29683 / DSM 1030 / JCM 2381 / KCTC 1655 / WB1) TaxID=931626 RepID=H6LKU7_ACEWD|nr:DNA alkylation repair protein [Acetobacterium woodii]AFA50056.1 putative DNA alkylation repair enzyme [Acetobacterium woodii DSM 1030]
MAEALKNIYTPTFLHDFGDKVRTVYKTFPKEQFMTAILMQPWDELPLRARMNRIATVLGTCLPEDYNQALAILFAIEKDCTGFPYLFFPDFVAIYGLNSKHWDLSIKALERFTKGSSAEFAIRPFILQDPERAMTVMHQWSKHPNEHVRRLSSEGCRPRLPWGIHLPLFKKDPTPVLDILDNLKADPSLYVRKSVANNLNDIAKDNPGLVLTTAQRWIGTNPDTDWILRQGCRTLVRKANPIALELFGYPRPSAEAPLFKNALLTVAPDQLFIGTSCDLHYSLDMTWDSPVHIRLEYGIDFIKANGKPSRKLFLLSDKTVKGDAHLSGSRRHRFADLTTRRHHPGAHQIVLLINGQEAAQTNLLLQPLQL